MSAPSAKRPGHRAYEPRGTGIFGVIPRSECGATYPRRVRLPLLSACPPVASNGVRAARQYSASHSDADAERSIVEQEDEGVFARAGVKPAVSTPAVLVEKAAADLEILVVAARQFRRLVLGEALRESDHLLGRRLCGAGRPRAAPAATVLRARLAPCCGLCSGTRPPNSSPRRLLMRLPSTGGPCARLKAVAG